MTREADAMNKLFVRLGQPPNAFLETVPQMAIIEVLTILLDRLGCPPYKEDPS